MNPSSLRALILSALAALLAYGVVIMAADREAIYQALTGISPAVWTAVLGLSLFNYALRYLRWDLYLRKLDTRIPLRCNLTLYMAGFAFTTTPGKVGEALRSLYLKRFDMGYTASLSVLFVERLSDLIAVALLSVLITSNLSGYEAFPAMVLLALFVLLLLVFWRPAQQALGARIHEHKYPRLHKLKLNIGKGLHIIRDLSQPAPLAGGLALGLLAWGAEGFGLYLVADALDIPVSPLTATGIYGISVIIGALSFVPGGLGTTEVSMGLLLVAMGATPADATVATLICRLSTLWFAVVLGLISVMLIETGRWGPRCESDSRA